MLNISDDEFDALDTGREVLVSREPCMHNSKVVVIGMHHLAP